LFSFNKCIVDNYNQFKNISLESAGLSADKFQDEDYLVKLLYLKSIVQVKNLLKSFNPDILHAHYASSYGMIGAFSAFHPFVLSVWGTDVFNFPRKSLVHRKIFEFNLVKADRVLSTSNFMAKEVKKYTDKVVDVIPFGIDLEVYKSISEKKLFRSDDIVLGTVKSLESQYRIDVLITSFKSLKEKHPTLPLKLLIVGKGSKEKKLKDLVKSFGIEKDTVFSGYIKPNEVPSYHKMFNVEVYLSDESFGVSALEASACGKPVIASSTGGLAEIIINNETGFLVESKNVEQIVEAVEKLIFNKNLLEEFGKNGKDRVEKYFNWEDNVDQMVKIYGNLVDKSK
jgi:glycosyltransferase involved in cell wall biosynthesis